MHRRSVTPTNWKFISLNCVKSLYLLYISCNKSEDSAVFIEILKQTNNTSCRDSVRALLRHKNGVTTSWHLPTEPFVSHLKPYVTSSRFPGLIRRWTVADALNARHTFEVPVDKGDWIISMVVHHLESPKKACHFQLWNYENGDRWKTGQYLAGVI